MSKNVCVFSSSSNTLDESFYQDAREIGILLAQNGMNLVYGGSCVGMMYETAKEVKKNGGRVFGVMPKRLYDFGVASAECDEFFLTDDMRDRKAKLDELSDSVVALAGGFGTLEELSEMIVQKQLGYNNKAIVILNTNGFYDNMIKFFDDIVKNSFARSESRELYYVAQTPQEAIQYLKNYIPSDKVILKDDIYTQTL